MVVAATEMEAAVQTEAAGLGVVERAVEGTATVAVVVYGEAVVEQAEPLLARTAARWGVVGKGMVVALEVALEAAAKVEVALEVVVKVVEGVAPAARVDWMGAVEAALVRGVRGWLEVEPVAVGTAEAVPVGVTAGVAMEEEATMVEVAMEVEEEAVEG